MTQPEPGIGLIEKLERIAYKALEETIGRKDLHLALQLGNLTSLADRPSEQGPDIPITLSEISDLHAALEKLYGLRGSQGLALRSGRACFKYGLHEFGTQLGLDRTSFKLLPLNAKISIASNQFAGILNDSLDKKVKVEENASNFLITISDCPICRDRQAATPICNLAVGVLQEALYWISGGKHFQIEETECIAKGDPVCTLVIQKQPLE